MKIRFNSRMGLLWLVALAFASLGGSAETVEETCTPGNDGTCLHKRTGNFSEDALVNELVTWITENGGTVDHRQMVRKDADENVYATAFIPKGTVLLSVPWDIVLFLQDPDEKWLCGTVQALHQELKAYEQGTSSFAVYMQYLMSKLNSTMIPGLWSEAGQKLLLAVLGENLPPQSDANDNLLNLEWWQKSCGGKVDGEDIVKDALLLVQGYKSPGLLARSDDDDDDEEEEHPRYAMIPLYDSYSQRNGNWLNTNLKSAVVDDDFVMTASRDIQAGEPIHTRSTDSTATHFLESGRVEKLPQRHSFTFLDDKAGSNNEDVVVAFVLDKFEDEDGELVHAVKWVNDIHGGSRACKFLEVELKRLRHIHDFLKPDQNYLGAVPPHERNAIYAYTSALIDALSAAVKARYEPMPVTEWTLVDYEVAGVNLGAYNLIGEEEPGPTSTKPYELFHDFDISHLIYGDEGWKDMIEYRRTLDRPSLSFYVDKVARKRWLPSKGIAQAKQYVLKYASELTYTGDERDERRTLFEQIPNMTDYAAKPSHHSEGSGVWLVSYNWETKVTSFSSTARQLEHGRAFDKWEMATALAHNLHLKARDGESTSLKGVKPGVVVEERMVELDHYHRAPVEFCVFVIWGKVWVAQMNFIDGEDRYLGQWMYRNGTIARGDESRELEDYVEFSRVVEIAETLGANKDMFRVDIFVGIPAGSLALRADASREERLRAVEYVVNECEIYPTTNFRRWQQLAQDGARLWVAGYKKGNYVTVPNTEVPREFLETGSLGQSAATEEETCTAGNDSTCLHKRSGNFSEDALVNELVNWIAENGGTVDRRQMVRKDTDENVYATAFIPKGTVLLSVPWDIVLFSQDPDENWLCGTVQALHQELKAYKQGTSSFAVYMQYLMSKLNSTMIPGLWSEAGQKLLLAVLGDNLPPQSDANDNLLNLEWWQKSCGGKVDGEDIVKDALLLVQGYKSPGLLARSDEIGENPRDAMSPKEKNPRYAMIPFYDIYSQRNGEWLNTNLKSAVVNNDFIMTASRDIEAGEPIHTRSTDSTATHFLESGRVEKLPQRHSFTFHDKKAGSPNQKLVVAFVLDKFEDEDGELVHDVTWVSDIHGGRRACKFVEVELDRLSDIHDFLKPDQNYLEAVPPHERNAIYAYTSALIDALSAAIKARYEPMPVTEWTLVDYEVAGVNLGAYNLIGEEEPGPTSTKPYELFQDFDISDLIYGDEGWKDLIEYRRALVRPSLSFYVDKVARKRWLPSKGIAQAKQYVLKYAFELTDTGDEHDERRTLFEQIPNMTDYAAKPSHYSEGAGVWLVSYNKETKVTSFSSTARQLDHGRAFDKWEMATALAHNLHFIADKDESTSLRGVKPGVVVEERMVEVDHYDRPPVEYCVIVIWGKVWVVQMNVVEGEGRYLGRWRYRNGTKARGYDTNELEDYVEFSRVVEIAETLGANKDMFRVDIFVGLPAGSPALRAGASREERLRAVEYVVNECEIYPTTNFRLWPQLEQDGARLWVAGYKKGNYVIVPNTEVPREFLETGSLSEL